VNPQRAPHIDRRHSDGGGLRAEPLFSRWLEREGVDVVAPTLVE
jgi:hypothetical protein